MSNSSTHLLRPTIISYRWVSAVMIQLQMHDVMHNHVLFSAFSLFFPPIVLFWFVFINFISSSRELLQLIYSIQCGEDVISERRQKAEEENEMNWNVKVVGSTAKCNSLICDKNVRNDLSVRFQNQFRMKEDGDEVENCLIVTWWKSTKSTSFPFGHTLKLHLVFFYVFVVVFLFAKRNWTDRAYCISNICKEKSIQNQIKLEILHSMRSERNTKNNDLSTVRLTKRQTTAFQSVKRLAFVPVSKFKTFYFSFLSFFFASTRPFPVLLFIAAAKCLPLDLANSKTDKKTQRMLKYFIVGRR